MMLKQDLEDIPYLNKAVIEEYADITIRSNDGEKYLVNKLLLMSWSQIKGHQLKEVLLSHFQSNEDIIISSDFYSQDIRLFCDFVMEGLLPCSADEIIAGNISREALQIFNSFGISLENIVGFTPISVNIESTEEIINESVDLDSNFNVEDSNLVSRSEIQPFADEEEVPKPAIVNGSAVGNANETNENKSKDKRFQCDLCPKSYVHKRGLSEHVISAHEERERSFPCKVCGETFKTTTIRYYHHKKMHLQPPSNQCSVCPKKFAMVAQLRDHIANDHKGEGDFICEVCDVSI